MIQTGTFTSLQSVPPVANAVSGTTPLGSHAARGAMWTILFSIFSKAATLGSQVVLAWFLTPEHFGLVAMTLSVMSFTAIVGSSIFKNLLIQRADRFEEEAGQVFWMCLGFNLVAALVLVGSSPLAGYLFQEPKVIPLILVAAVAIPLQSLPAIYGAFLARSLRFRPIAMIHFGTSLAQNLLAVLLAWQGFGAYALIVPLIGAALFMSVSFRLAAGRIRLGLPHPKRWLALASPASWLMLNALFFSLQTYGANFVIGWAKQDSVVTGFYYWGCSVSAQAIFLLATNLQSVLFPVLTKLNVDPARQLEGIKRAGRTLTAVLAPVCLLQILLAGPLVALLFKERWQPAVPVIQWISLGLLTQPLGLLATSLLLARGEFRRLAGVTALVCFSVMGAALVGAAQGDQTEIARMVGLALLVANLTAGWIAFRQLGQGWRALLATIGPVLLAMMPVAILGFWLSQATAGNLAWLRILALAGMILGTYALLVRWFLPQVLEDILIRLRFRDSAPKAAELQTGRPLE